MELKRIAESKLNLTMSLGISFATGFIIERSEVKNWIKISSSNFINYLQCLEFLNTLYIEDFVYF